MSIRSHNRMLQLPAGTLDLEEKRPLKITTLKGDYKSLDIAIQAAASFTASSRDNSVPMGHPANLNKGINRGQNKFAHSKSLQNVDSKLKRKLTKPVRNASTSFSENCICKWCTLKKNEMQLKQTNISKSCVLLGLLSQFKPDSSCLSVDEYLKSDRECQFRKPVKLKYKKVLYVS